MGTNLATRVRSNNEAVKNGDAPPSLTVQIQSMEKQFALAMPRGMEAAQLVRDALTCLKQTPKLAECDSMSVLGSLMTCAQLGLRPGVLGHAWLLPFWSSKKRRYEAQLVVGYQGLVELAHRSGRIKSLVARTVYEADTFDVDYGLADSLVHKPVLFGERGKPIAYYAVAKFTTGGHVFLVVNHDEMVAYRDQHATARGKDGKVFGPWVDNFEGMAHKTCVRQLAKWMPKSTELAAAIEADESIRFNAEPTADIATNIEHPTAIPGEVVPNVDADGVIHEPPGDSDADQLLDPWETAGEK